MESDVYIIVSCDYEKKTTNNKEVSYIYLERRVVLMKMMNLYGQGKVQAKLNHDLLISRITFPINGNDFILKLTDMFLTIMSHLKCLIQIASAIYFLTLV